MSLEAEIGELEQWLANRPSATMDPAFDERLLKQQRLRYLKSTKRKDVRRPTKMMEAQQVGEDDLGELT